MKNKTKQFSSQRNRKRELWESETMQKIAGGETEDGDDLILWVNWHEYPAQPQAVQM